MFWRLCTLQLLLVASASAGCFEQTSCTNCLTTFGCHWCQSPDLKGGECNTLLSIEPPASCPTRSSTNWVSHELECPAPAAPVLPEIASWMEGAMEFIGSKALFNISVPGTHDSLSYDVSTQISEHEECNQFATRVGSRLPVLQDTLVRGLSMAQKLTVVEQLDSGVRSFDIRVVKGVMNGVNSWRGVHCTLTYQTVDVYLKQMVDWLRLHTKEVLVVSISQHGDGSAVWPMSDQELLELFGMFNSTFGSMLIDAAAMPPQSTSISDYASTGHRVLLLGQQSRRIDPSGRFVLDMNTQYNHLYNEPGVLTPKGYLDWWAAQRGTQLRNGKWSDINGATSMPYTDATYFEQYIEGLGHVKSCPKYFEYLHDWCPPSLLDIAGLSNYYVQRAVEAAYLSGETVPNAFCFDAVDAEGTIRVGHDLIAGGQRKASTAAQHTAKYALTATMALINVPKTANTSWVQSMHALRAKFPLQGWDFELYGRMQLGNLPNASIV